MISSKLTTKGLLFYAMHLVILQSTIAGIIYFLSLNRTVFRIVFSVLYVFLGILAYWVYSLDISISAVIIEASFQIEPTLIKDLLSVHFILYLIFLVVSLGLIMKLYKKVEVKSSRVFTVISMALISGFFIVEKAKPSTFKAKLPYQFFYSFYHYATQGELALEDVSNLEFKSNLKDNIQLTFVLGETVRADHLSINGYYRNTTPKLSQIKENLVSYPQMYTNKMFTYQSIPQILSNQSIYDTLNKDIRSVYSVLNKNNVKTTWIGNQHLESSYMPIATSNQNVINIDEWRSSLSYNKAKDEELLPYLEAELTQTASLSSMTTLHMVGSHWWYEKRYGEEFRKYTPVIDSKYFPSLSNESIINSYDNTLLYLDFFLNEVINAHKNIDKPSIVIYVSDHGESLGENDKWLHGHESKAVANPAFLVWYSEEFKKRYPEKVAYINALDTPDLNTDVVYPLILNIFEIEAHEINE
jgi:glucan phosphoethanolaminetransferase (alkaline phosphatase superfamily)